MEGTTAVRSRRSGVAGVIGVVALAGAMLLTTASPSTAWTNSCNNGETLTPGVPPTGEDFGVDIGPGIIFVGVDLELAELVAGNPGSIVCVNDDGYSVTLTTTGGPYVTVRHCVTPSFCPPVIGATGLDGAPAPTTTIGSTTVCAGICTTVPFTPVKVDTGYDVVVDGAKQADLCVSIGTGC